MDVPVCECFGGGGGGGEGRGRIIQVCVETGKERHGPRDRKLPPNGKYYDNTGGRALFMTLNVNMNVENSIKNIYICLLIRQLFRSLL